MHVIECSSFQIDLAPLARSVGRHPAQRHGRSSRPPRHAGELRGDQGAAGRGRAAAAPRSSASTTTGAQAVADRIERGGKQVVRVSVRQSALRRHLCRRRPDHARRGRHRARRRADRRHRLAARRAQCAERRLRGRRRGSALGLDRRGDPAGPRVVSRPCAPHGAGRRAGATCCSSTTPRRPTRTPPRRRSRSFNDIFWIAGGKPKTGGIASLAGLFPAHPQGLSDRRGGGGFAGTLRGQGRRTSMAGTLDRAVELAARDAAGRRCWRAGRAAVAGLRVLRPVPRISRCAATAFRDAGAWRCAGVAKAELRPR